MSKEINQSTTRFGNQTGTTSMQPLVPLTFPLTGASLIEASAGTGKTYTISSFYLRLVVGHECEPLPVEKILLVTFTNAATNELKERLQARLHSAFLDFEQGKTDDELVAKLMRACDDSRLAKQRLLVAKQSMDNAAIFTIHGFCQRMLSEHAFESGSLYEQTLILDDSEWVQLACVDFWRMNVVNLPLHELGLLLSFWPSPEVLQQLIRPLLYRNVRLTEVSQADYQANIQRFVEAVNHVKHWWLNNNVAARLSEAKLKARSKVCKPENLAAFTRFAQSAGANSGSNSDLIFQVKNGSKKESWELFSSQNVAKARKKDSASLDDLDFTPFDDLTTLQETMLLSLQQYYVSFARSWVKQRLHEHKQRFNLLSPDDLLQDLQRALLEGEEDHATDHSNPLAKVIGQQFPVAMVDEFQDTDPVQFDIFRRIYLQPNTMASALVMIGDPKQAIYGFRGGDIFTYLQARQLILPERQFTLSKNYRSQRSLVNAFNRLFIESERAFEFGEQIPYISVSANKDPMQLVASAQLANTPHALKTRALNINFLPATENGLWMWNQAAQHLARYCAQQIAGLLQPGAFTFGADQEGQNTKAVQAGDVCVLVRDRNEAMIMKSALAKQGVESVFLIRRSVFVSDVAWQMLLLLRALHAPQDESTVRAALLSELFNFNAHSFDALIQDEIRWHNVLSVFMEGHGLWQKQGVIRGINRVLAHFDVTAHLKQHFDDGMRRITDLRHISELLQVEASLLQGESLLLNWFEQRIAEPDHGHEAQQLRLETDENLVQITTIHASKGLQYPLVFVPFAARFREFYNEPYFRPAAQNESLDQTHETGELVWDVSANDEAQALQRAQRMGEDARLLYVALTRAIYHCWIGLWNTAAGRSKKSSGFATTAIGQVLLHQSQNMASIPDLTNITDEHILSALDTLSSETGKSETENSDGIHINQLSPEDLIATEQEVERVESEAMAPDQANTNFDTNSNTNSDTDYRAAVLTRAIQPDWVLTSYSGISAQHAHHDEVLWEKDSKARDEDSSDMLADGAIQDLLYDTPLNVTAPEHRFEFERGVNAGSFLHAIYELSDWQLPPVPEESLLTEDKQALPENSMERVMLEQASRYQVNLGSPQQTVQWIRETLHTPLRAATGFSNNLTLAALQPTQKLAEMEFYLPLEQVHEAAFNQLLEAYQFPAKYPYQFGKERFGKERLGKERFGKDSASDRTSKDRAGKGVLNGMLKGFIDLTFEFEGRFYVADYKSNHLGESYDDYQQDALRHAMFDHDYNLQALLYTVALHRFLQVSLPGYQYEQHIGGAWYLFIRGMHPAQTHEDSSAGVLHVVPPQELVMKLDALFGQQHVARLQADNGQEQTETNHGEQA